MASTLGEQLSFWTIGPFGLLLVSIAVLPQMTRHWFDNNRNKALVAGLFAVPTVTYLIVRFPELGLRSAASSGRDYIAFMALLAALYTISGGIYITGNLRATPRNNLAFLLAGAVLANFIGTLGASMLLIRPLLRANSERTHARHTIVFFIFIVCNLGGLLIPLGPPLYLGFLRGVPFFWPLRLWPQWLLGLALILAVFLILETYHYRREPAAALRMDEADYVPARIAGKMNLLLFLAVIGVVALSGPLGRMGNAIHFPFLRELLLAALVVVSLKLTPTGPRAANHFRWAPMIEVAVLFAGIFATMIPALALLEARGSALGLSQPWQYYWSAGGLSAVLDNAPTYLTFSAAAQGQLGLGSLGALIGSRVASGAQFAPAQFLAAVSCGSVMMGAITYIGNAPNLAVRAISEHSGLKMPSFFGYMKYSLAVLLPVFGVMTAVFFA